MTGQFIRVDANFVNFSATYDAHYLALPQRFQADFYTGDKRLFNAVNSTLTWIHLVE